MFSGIYENYNAAKENLTSTNNLFDEQIWTETVKYSTENSINNTKNPNYPLEWYLREFITLLAAESFDQKGVKVLDFGGGPGTTYADIQGKLPTSNFEYHIIDTPANCEIGKNLFPSNTNLHFFSANPNNNHQFDIPVEKYDIVMSSSTLQYSHNWRELLTKLIKCNPKYFVLLRLLSGDMPTFTTIQYITMTYGPYKGTYCGDIPCTFINRQELISFFDDFGYSTLLDIFERNYSEELKLLPEPYSKGHLRTLILRKRLYECRRS
jgi:putative methyltransferase (TIGR04325 family)